MVTDHITGTVAYGINNLGQIVVATMAQAASFSGAVPTPILASAGPSGTNAHGINDSGQITGQIFENINLVGCGILYSGGVYTTLPVGGNGTLSNEASSHRASRAKAPL